MVQRGKATLVFKYSLDSTFGDKDMTTATLTDNNGN